MYGKADGPEGGDPLEAEKSEIERELLACDINLVRDLDAVYDIVHSQHPSVSDNVLYKSQELAQTDPLETPSISVRV